MISITKYNSTTSFHLFLDFHPSNDTHHPSDGTILLLDYVIISMRLFPGGGATSYTPTPSKPQSVNFNVCFIFAEGGGYLSTL